LTPAQCLHYCLTRPAVCSVMAGFQNVDQLQDALDYEIATQEELDYASVLAGAPKHSFHGQCTYCGHCAPCVMGINIALVNKYADLAAMQSQVPQGVGEHYRELELKAGDCIGCGECESRCPFGVPIAQKMQETLALFGE